MRGPAPSIECPRCGQQAPPADAVARFVTCRGCGLSIDAAPRERYVPVRRARPAEATEDEAGAAPEQSIDEAARANAAAARQPRGGWLRNHLSWRQAVFALVLLFGSAYLKTRYFPDKHDRVPRGALERLERVNRERAESEEAEADRLVNDALAQSKIAACEQLAALRTREGACPTPQATADLRAASDHALEGMAAATAADLGARCAAAAAELEAAHTRLGCR